MSHQCTQEQQQQYDPEYKKLMEMINTFHIDANDWTETAPQQKNFTQEQINQLEAEWEVPIKVGDTTIIFKN